MSEQEWLLPGVEVVERTATERYIDALRQEATKLERLGQHKAAKRKRVKADMMERGYSPRRSGAQEGNKG